MPRTSRTVDHGDSLFRSSSLMSMFHGLNNHDARLGERGLLNVRVGARPDFVRPAVPLLSLPKEAARLRQCDVGLGSTALKKVLIQRSYRLMGICDHRLTQGTALGGRTPL